MIIGLELTVFPAGRGEGLETELNQHPKMYSSIHADIMKRSPNTWGSESFLVEVGEHFKMLGGM